MFWESKSCRSWQRVSWTIFAVFGRGPCLILCQDISWIWNACGRSARNVLAVHSRGTVHIVASISSGIWASTLPFTTYNSCSCGAVRLKWCTVWKGTAQDCIDHMRRVHKVPLSVKVANLARFFLPWTVTSEQWTDMMMGWRLIRCCLAALVRLYVIAIGSSVGLEVMRLSGARTYIGCVSSSRNQTPRWCAGSIASLLRN